MSKRKSNRYLVHLADDANVVVYQRQGGGSYVHFMPLGNPVYEILALLHAGKNWHVEEPTRWRFVGSLVTMSVFAPTGPVVVHRRHR